MITINQIAEEVGVSRSAVSHVLNGRGAKVGESTRKEIEAVLQRHRYQRNGLVRALKAKRTFSLGVLLPSVRFSFYAQILDAMEVRARAQGYHLVMVQTHMDSGIIRSEIEHLRERRVDGFVVVPGHKEAEIYEWLKNSGDPLVFLDSHIDGLEIPYIDSDDRQGAVLAASHLLQAGHRKFLIHAAEEADRSPMALERLAGSYETLKAGGAKSIHVCRDGLFIEEGYRAVRSALDAGIKFTAVISSTDMAAIGAIRALQDAGLSVPDDVAVIGHGNLEEGKYITPALSTIHQSPDKMGAGAFELMMELLNSKGTPAPKIIPPELILRRST